MSVASDAVIGSVAGLRFDLFQNPFAVLNLSPDATRDDVVVAFDDGIADSIADEAILREARRQLLAPKLRMQATVEYLPDATQGERDEAISVLRKNLPLSDLIAVAKGLPSFSRTVFLAQVAQVRPSSGILRFFVQSRADLDRAAISKVVTDLLTTSGNPRPQIEAIDEAIDDVTLSNAKRLFFSYSDTNAAAVDMTRCLVEELPHATNELVSVLSVVVDAYVNMASQGLQTARRGVEDAAESIRRDPTMSGGTAYLISVLDEWDAIAQPQQLLANHKGRDEGGARDLFQFLRGLMLELANEHDRAGLALEINRACLSVFAELPRAERQLRDDQISLEGLADKEKLQDLSAFIESAKKDPDPIVRNLSQAGFGHAATGQAARLLAIFNRSLAKTRGTPAYEYVWGFVRVLALELNNELGEAAASRRLIEGLHSHPEFRDAPAKIREAIETDLQTVRSNAIHSDLNRAIQSKDTAKAKAHLAELLSITGDTAERAQYQQAMYQIDAAKRWRVIKWLIWGGIGVIVVGFAVSQNNRGGSYSTRTTSYSAPAAPKTTSLEEIRPLVGTNRSFNRGNIRYCLYQNARLDAAKATLAYDRNDSDVRTFNLLIDDYNSRCGSYNYYPDDLTAVQFELVDKRSVLTAEGQGLLRKWKAN